MIFPCLHFSTLHPYDSLQGDITGLFEELLVPVFSAQKNKAKQEKRQMHK